MSKLMPLDDFRARRRETPESRENVRVIREHRAAVLGAATAAIDAGHVTAARRVSLSHDGFPDSEFR
jgi:hypothetical protein